MSAVPTPFAARPASSTWEQIPLAGSAAGFFWAWFKPPAAPECLVVRLADDLLKSGSDSPPVTLLHLLRAAAIDPTAVSGWSLYGSPFESRGVATFLNQPLPSPPPGADPQLYISFAVAASQITSDAITAAMIGSAAVAPSTQVALSTQAGSDVAHIYDMIDSDWNMSLLLEKQLVLLRKQLSNMLTRLTTLDRDLSPDERMYGDRQAKSDWQEARRWLKDGAAKLLRYIKEHDTGDTSNAGKREWFNTMYQQVVQPRRPVEDIVSLQRAFEGHRRRLQNLQTNMATALQGAGSDGEKRAQQVLERLSRSVRDARAKRRGRLEPGKLKRKHLGP